MEQIQGFQSWQVEALNQRHFHLILMPTEKCNFRCTYCYESFDNGEMSDDIVRGVINLLSQRLPIIDSLKVSWFGGEPLVAFKVMEAISTHILLQLNINKRVSYHSEVTTNGYLLSLEKFVYLNNLGVKNYQISLDGFRKDHDKTRVMKGTSAGTFDQIVKNLIDFKNTDLKFNVLLRCHLTFENKDRLLNFLKWVDREILDDKRFLLYVRPVSDMGKTGCSSIPTINREQFDEFINEVSKIIQNSNQLLNLSSDLPQTCYASKSNSIVIRSDGSLAKCTVLLNNNKNLVGRLNSDGSIDIDRETYISWIQPTLSGDIKSASCPSRGLFESSK